MYFLFLTLYNLSALVCLGVTIAGLWTSFAKAGRPGWAAIVPVYNLIVWLDVAGKPWWWVFIVLSPLVVVIIGVVIGIAAGSFIVALIFYLLGLVGSLALSIFLSISFAQNFGKGVGFAVGLALLSPVFYPLLGFGDAVYSPPGSSFDEDER